MTPRPGSGDALSRLDAVAQVGLRLARSAPSGRVLLAQLALGADPRLVPRPWGEELLAAMAEAQASVNEPLGRRQVEQTLRRAWNVKATDELDDLDPDPAAVTPTSQVHRGVLDGAAVAVKVQRPGLARTVRQDLALLDALIAPLHAAFPALDARAVLGEIGERVRDEFDPEHEAANARQLRRRLRHHPRLLVPAPVARLAGEDVLVREWVDGHPLADAAPPARDTAAAALVEFVVGGAGAGFMNAGITAADVLLTDDGRVAIVDHGVCCTVDRGRATLTRDALRAILADDADGLADALAALGWLDPGDAGPALVLLRELLGPLIAPAPVRLDVDAVVEAGRRVIPRRDQVLASVRAGAPAPEDIWPMRGIAQLFTTIAAIEATAPWSQLVLGALDDD